MSGSSKQVQELLGNRQGWTPIAVAISRNHPSAASMMELARERQWQLIQLETYGGQLPPDLDVRGAIVNWLPTEKHALELLELGVPTVRMGNDVHPDDALMPSILQDRAATGRLAAEHFAQRDFKHIAFIGRTPWGMNKTLYEAFALRAGELGCTAHLRQEMNVPTPKMVDGGPLPDRARWQARREAFTQWLTALPKPVGLLAFGDLVAVRYCQWASGAGLRVPEDVAVLGIGNDEFICECAQVPLSSVALDHAGVAKTAMDTLQRLIDGQPPEHNPSYVPPKGVVTRRSTDFLAASDPIVIRALRYMWDHVTEDLTVDQIARSVHVSRRKLERAFHADLEHGVYQEFQRRRLDKACEFLLQTDWKIADISRALKFSSPVYFSQAFRATFQTTPGQYRRARRGA
ncbi:MAG: helix-turn-helix domain-containing protein [Phycisphaera sp.]|nr:helix-turn-helix domain-containing protein [Phycisphaera sp.]